MDYQNPTKRLFVLPDEKKGGMPDSKSHPHMGEGNCGGNEGHGTNERRGRSSVTQRGHETVSDNRTQARNSQKRMGEAPDGKNQCRDTVPNAVAEQKKESLKQPMPQTVKAINPKTVCDGIRMAVLLGEPACMRYGWHIRRQRRF